MKYKSTLQQSIDNAVSSDRLVIQDQIVNRLKCGNGEPDNKPSRLPSHIPVKRLPPMNEIQWARFIKAQKPDRYTHI